MSGRLEEVFAQRLRAVAGERGIPLSHVADRAGIARSHFWLLLDGSVSTSLGVLQRIAEVLEVDPLDLLRPDAKTGTAGRTATPTKVAAARKSVEPTPADYARANPVKPKRAPTKRGR